MLWIVALAACATETPGPAAPDGSTEDGPQGLAQLGSPGLAPFHSAKSMGFSLRSFTSTRAPACMSSRLRLLSLP